MPTSQLAAGGRAKVLLTEPRAIRMQKVFHYNVDQALPRLGFARMQLNCFLCSAEKPVPLEPRHSAGQRGFSIASCLRIIRVGTAPR